MRLWEENDSSHGLMCSSLAWHITGETPAHWSGGHNNHIIIRSLLLFIVTQNCVCLIVEQLFVEWNKDGYNVDYTY